MEKDLQSFGAIKERGHSIFLDLKLHDIPHTVKMAMKNLARLDVDIVNVHASGSKAMMQAAIEGLEEEKGKDASFMYRSNMSYFFKSGSIR